MITHFRQLALIVGLLSVASAGYAQATSGQKAPTKNGIRKTQTAPDDPVKFEFVTGDLSGVLSPQEHHHGIVRIMHRAMGWNIVQPGKCFLNAEYYNSPNSPKHVAAWEAAGGASPGYLGRAIPRRTSQQRLTSYAVDGNRFRIHFPATLCPDDIKIELDLTYEFHPDNKIDLT